MKRTKWTTEQENKLIELFPNESNYKIAELLNVSYHSVRGKAKTLGLKKSIDFLKNKSGRFRKNFIPHNKGKKWSDYMSEEGQAKVRKNLFTKEGRIHLGRPLYSERIDRDGYIIIKAQTIRGKTNFIQKHRWIYEKEFGEIPDKHIVIFKDGNNRNFDINNLQCISRSENMKRNSLHNLHPEILGNIYLMKSINNRIKQSENTK